MTWTLIAGNVLGFVWQISGSSVRFEEIIYTYGYVPYLVLNQGTYYMFLTSMFLHADWWHLGGNMLFLWVFGDNIEDICGHSPYFFFYLLSGIFASLLFTLFTTDPTIPAIGASGAVSGVLGAYLVRFPHARIRTLVFFGYFVRLTAVPAYVTIGLWFLLQLVYGLLGAPGVAWWAHVGGFLAGAGLIRVFARRGHQAHVGY
jgi:membrane associated rhomboid family serine protease